MDIDESNKEIEAIKSALEAANASTKRQVFEKFALAALGSIPWVGGFISAAASFGAKSDGAAGKANNLQTRWLEEHQKKIDRLMNTLNDVASRFESLGDQINERIQSEDYLSIVRKAFRTWDQADTAEKRQYVANLISNSAGTNLCSDDVIRLFVDWLELYHEAHFAVIREIYKHPSSTRHSIWQNIHGKFPRDNSAEADLFKRLIRDLTLDGVIRQEREVNHYGQFVKKDNHGRKGQSSSTMESPFEDTKSYELTELGKQFVHYTMNEVVPRVGGMAANDR